MGSGGGLESINMRMWLLFCMHFCSGCTIQYISLILDSLPSHVKCAAARWFAGALRDREMIGMLTSCVTLRLHNSVWLPGKWSWQKLKLFGYLTKVLRRPNTISWLLLGGYQAWTTILNTYGAQSITFLFRDTHITNQIGILHQM